MKIRSEMTCLTNPDTFLPTRLQIRAVLIVLWLMSLVSPCLGQASTPLYQNDFEAVELESVPEDLVVLAGNFAVKEDGGNKFLELPGAPLDTFGVLFGPAEKDEIVASARAFGTAKGRRYPTFALGLNSVGGYRLQVSPGKKALELVRADVVRAAIPFNWQPGTWTCLRLQVRKTSAGLRVEGKAWPEGKPEPVDWMISTDVPDQLPAGRANVFGSPFAGTPIRFDDLVVKRREPEPSS